MTNNYVHIVIEQFARNKEIVWMEQVEKVFRKESDAQAYVDKMTAKLKKNEKRDYKIEKFTIF